MHDPIQLAIKHVLNNIPYEILDIAFVKNHIHDNQLEKTEYSIDEGIIDNVIMMRVFDDCNLKAGKVKDLILKSEYVMSTPTDTDAMIMRLGQFGLYKIPLEERDGQSINRVISVSYPSWFNYSYNLNPAQNMLGGGVVNSTARAVLNSNTMGGSPIRPTGEVISGDIIKLMMPQFVHMDWVCTVLLSYDEQFTNMNIQALPAFKELVLQATKFYIYTLLYIKMDQTYLEGGQEVATIRDKVLSYEEAGTQYEETLKRFSRAAGLDKRRLQDTIRYMI